MGPPKFLSDLNARAPWSSDHGRAAVPWPFVTAVLPAHAERRTAPTKTSFRGSIHGSRAPCVHFTPPVTRRRATLGPGWRPALAGWARPTRSRSRFHFCVSTSDPPTSDLLGVPPPEAPIASPTPQHAGARSGCPPRTAATRSRAQPRAIPGAPPHRPTRGEHGEHGEERGGEPRARRHTIYAR
jgi:hypothetical protein